MDSPINGNDQLILVENSFNKIFSNQDYTRDEILNNFEPNEENNEFVSEEEEESMNEMNERNQFQSQFCEETVQKIVYLSKNEKPEIKDNSENFYVFTKGENVVTEEFSQKPLLKDSDLVLKNTEKRKKEDIHNMSKKDSNLVLKNDKKRKKDMDNMSKKVKGKISKRLLKILKYKIKKFSFQKFNQKSNKMKNKEYLNMRLKELLKNIYIEFINTKTKNNVNILKEDDKKFLASLENDFDDEKLRPILNMKMEDIYIEFFKSKEYQDLIQELIDKGNSYYYIFTFIQKNKHFVEYYKMAKSRKKKKES